MRITDDQLVQIREATNIVDLIGETVNLKKRGANWIGLCPFHNERTPSFNVRDDKGIFKCFGCGKGGDVFSFVMETEGLTFPEAAKRLADKANIKLEDASEEEKAEQSEKEKIHSTIRAVAAWYYRALRSPIGAEPLQYLHRRGFGEAILKKFGVGYAPDLQGALIKAVQKKGYNIEFLEMAGIIARSSGRDWYERFRGRIIFPVFSPTGRIIGFGGRIYTDAQKQAELAKYINSPDTPVYHKSKVLYGIYQAKDAIRKLGSAVIVEGYADVIALHQAGFENVVAASGTSLTKDQLELLKRYTNTITLIFDADLAGRNATERGIELALQAGLDVNIVLLRQGEDPDSLIRKFGADRFADALKNYESFIETKARWFDEQGALDDPAKAAAAVKSVVQTIAKIPDQIKREFFVHRLSGRFRITESALMSELDRELGRGARTLRKKEEREARNPEMQVQLSAPVRVRKALEGPQRVLLQAILADPIGVANHFFDIDFDITLIDDDLVQSIVQFILDEIGHGKDLSYHDVLAHFRSDEPRQELIVECSISTYAQSDEWKSDAAQENSQSLAVRAARQALAALMRHDVMLKLERVRIAIQQAPSQEQIERLMHESLTLARKLEALRDFAENV